MTQNFLSYVIPKKFPFVYSSAKKKLLFSYAIFEKKNTSIWMKLPFICFSDTLFPKKKSTQLKFCFKISKHNENI